ncbi:Apple domain-containing protein [Meloidogyne graminicola]|uniref:Apple domain-containing protein n=1 Tax=Meloidogyne graminicola TaxID=189291 RepID=A0A8S9ZNS5_9BILA|nr:Apple domain-containing protein [Meloidogyne graminicola]
MAFEWQRLGGQCTLKSRSLNGTVVNLANKNGGNNEENEDNGGNDLLFALCLDYGDTERDRFWDHEIGGPIVDSKINIEREECSKICSEFSKIKKRKINFDKYEENKLKEEEEKEEELNQFKLKEYNSLFNTKNIKRRIKQPIINKLENKKEQQQQQQFPAVIYNWRPVDQNDMESPLGECQCISVLQNIKLNFGSFSGFLI